MTGPVHVYPLKDIIEHVTDGGDCPCGPVTEPVVRGDGSVGWLIKHQLGANILSVND